LLFHILCLLIIYKRGVAAGSVPFLYILCI
jgi:hypothetical protein